MTQQQDHNKTILPPKEQVFHIRYLLLALLLTGGCLLGVTLGAAGAEDDSMRVSTAKQHICHLQAALRLYQIVKGHYPTKAQGLQVLQQLEGLAFKKIPKDPWGHAYVYRVTTTPQGTIPEVTSYGADRRPGGVTPMARDIRCE